ncbi:hypothetical protein ABPG72_011387 [Tetrahymena utriculariae]
MADKELDVFQVQLEKCIEIQSLTITSQSNNLQDKQLQKLIQNLPDFKNLKTLKLILRKNQITDEGTKSISFSLKYCQQLTDIELQLDYNLIRYQGILSIATALRNCTFITSLRLDICKNEIDDEGAEALSLAFKNFSSIKQAKKMLNVLQQKQKTAVYSLILCSKYCNFQFENSSDEGAQAIGQCLSNINNLNKLILYLDANNIGDKGISEFTLGLSNCTKIQVLNLSLYHNNITDEGYLKVDQCLQSLPNLLKLECFLSDSEQLLKSRDLINCRNIKVLSLLLQKQKEGGGLIKRINQILVDQFQKYFNEIQQTDLKNHNNFIKV